MILDRGPLVQKNSSGAAYHVMCAEGSGRVLPSNTIIPNRDNIQKNASDGFDTFGMNITGFNLRARVTNVWGQTTTKRLFRFSGRRQARKSSSGNYGSLEQNGPVFGVGVRDRRVVRFRDVSKTAGPVHVTQIRQTDGRGRAAQRREERVGRVRRISGQ